jgi:hypothetical protein
MPLSPRAIRRNEVSNGYQIMAVWWKDGRKDGLV